MRNKEALETVVSFTYKGDQHINELRAGPREIADIALDLLMQIENGNITDAPVITVDPHKYSRRLELTE